VLDKKEESIRLKLATLFTKIFKKDMECREEMYKFVTKNSKRKSKTMSLEKYILSYYLENRYALLADL